MVPVTAKQVSQPHATRDTNSEDKASKGKGWFAMVQPGGRGAPSTGAPVKRAPPARGFCKRRTQRHAKRAGRSRLRRSTRGWRTASAACHDVRGRQHSRVVNSREVGPGGVVELVALVRVRGTPTWYMSTLTHAFHALGESSLGVRPSFTTPLPHTMTTPCEVAKMEWHHPAAMPATHTDAVSNMGSDVGQTTSSLCPTPHCPCCSVQ